MIKAYCSHNINQIEGCPFAISFKKEKGMFFDKEVFLDENKISYENKDWVYATYEAVIKEKK